MQTAGRFPNSFDSANVWMKWDLFSFCWVPCGKTVAFSCLHAAAVCCRNLSAKEQQNLLDQLNVDLTYAVCLNLAIQHQANDNVSWHQRHQFVVVCFFFANSQYVNFTLCVPETGVPNGSSLAEVQISKDNEALTIYTQIVKNKQYPFSGRFRVNMGNIYFKQEKWTAAIKMYRMALDQIPNNVQAGFVRFPSISHFTESPFAKSPPPIAMTFPKHPKALHNVVECP